MYVDEYGKCWCIDYFEESKNKIDSKSENLKKIVPAGKLNSRSFSFINKILSLMDTKFHSLCDLPWMSISPALKR